MFEKVTPEHIKIGDVDLPYICDIAVLEKLQKKYADLIVFEDLIIGNLPYFDEKGERIREKDKRVFPDMDAVCFAFIEMVKEGADIEGMKGGIPTAKDLKRQRFIKPIELALLVHKEYSKNF